LELNTLPAPSKAAGNFFAPASRAGDKVLRYLAQAALSAVSPTASVGGPIEVPLPLSPGTRFGPREGTT